MAKVLDFNAALSERELQAYLDSDRDEGLRDRVLSGLASSAESFVAWLFPAAIITPRNARVGNVYGSPGSSLVIETHGTKAGLWADFADPSQKSGNLIDLYMAARSVPFRQALEELAEWVGHGSRPEVSYSREQAVRKLKRIERNLGAQKGEWHYTDAEGTIIATVYRYEPGPGEKEFLPWDALRRRYGNPEVRPLYNLPAVLRSPCVVVCEGEKAASALIDRDIVATCVMGGSNSPLEKTDLEPLRGKDITIWPDADEPGAKFALAFAQAVKDIAASVQIIEPPADVPQGWDAADADEPLALLGMAIPSERVQPLLPYFWFDQAEPNLEANDFVENLLTSGAMSVVYGPSNCGKTFFVLDMALHVAWGRAWRGREVDRGAVVYLSLEGSAGVKNRIAAFRKHHGISDRLPFVVMPKPVDMLASGPDLAAIVQLVEFVASETALPVRMVIIDTLSRAMAGGDESSSKDMTALIRNCDKVRSATGAHICIVHHSGKDEAKGARGHSSLRAATDTEIEIKRDPELTLSSVRVTKQRDLEASDPFGFTLQSVALGTNRREKLVTSCVVVEADKSVILARQGEKVSPKEEEALATLHRLCEAASIDPETGEIDPENSFVPFHEWREVLFRGGTLNGNNLEVAKTQFKRLRTALNNKHKIEADGNMVRVRGT